MAGFRLKTEITIGLEWVYRTGAANAVAPKDTFQPCGCGCAPRNHDEELSGSEAKGTKVKKTLIAFAAVALLMGCARERAERQMSALNPDSPALENYRSDAYLDDGTEPPIKVRPRTGSQRGFGPGP